MGLVDAAAGKGGGTVEPAKGSAAGILGMIGGVRGPGQYWQGLDGSGMAHAANPDYADYSQLFREYTFEQRPGYVPVGERDGRTVFAAPDYTRGEDGNYLPVSAAEAQRLAADRGALIPTRDEVKALYGQATQIPMPTQPIGETGGAGDPAAYTAAVDGLLADVAPGSAIVHGKEFYSPDGASGGAAQPTLSPLAQGIIETAKALNIDPVDLATVISYETGGTFDPMQGGPTTQWGRHRGLIQFGEPQAERYGVDFSSPDAALSSQLGPEGGIVKYLLGSGFQPGMGLLDLYSTINAGGPGLYDRSDANNGGAPGSVRDKVEQQMGGHREAALRLLGGGEAPGRTPGRERVSTMNTPATPGAAPDEPRGLLDFLRGPKDETGDRSYLGGWLTPDRRDRLIMALQGMTLNPNQALIMAANDRIKGREEGRKTEAERAKEAEAQNRTLAFLRSQGRDDLANAVESGLLDGKSAASLFFAPEGGGVDKDRLSVEGGLRDDTTARLAPYEDQVAGQRIVEAAAAGDSGISDVALVNAFAKVLDPTSVVRESEFAAIANSGGLASGLKQTLLNTLENKQALPPEVRSEIIRLSTEIYNSSAEAAQKTLFRAKDLAEREGMDPRNVYLGTEPYTIEGRSSGQPLSQIRPQARPGAGANEVQGPPPPPASADTIKAAIGRLTPAQRAQFDALSDQGKLQMLRDMGYVQ